jgi:hypothetical protein
LGEQAGEGVEVDAGVAEPVAGAQSGLSIPQKCGGMDYEE